jgi:hypothetical protein
MRISWELKLELSWNLAQNSAIPALIPGGFPKAPETPLRVYIPELKEIQFKPCYGSVSYIHVADITSSPYDYLTALCI